MKKKICLAFLIFAGILVLAAWSPKETVAEPIKIGIILGVTGPAAFVCEQANQGHILAIVMWF